MSKGNHGDQPSCLWSIHNPGSDPLAKGSIFGWGAVNDPLGWGRTVPEVKKWFREIDAGEKVLTILLGTPAAPLQKQVAAALAKNLTPVDPKRRWVPCVVVFGKTGETWKFRSISAAATHLKVGRWKVLALLHRTPTVEIFEQPCRILRHGP